LTISLISNTTVKVALNNDDMKKYNIEFAQINQSSYASRQFLIKLLDEICDSNNIDLTHEKLYIEAFKRDDGCLLYISIGGEKFKSKEKLFCEMIYEFDDLSPMISVSTRLWDMYSHLIRSSELYCSERNYRLIVKAFSKADKKLSNALNEYGVLSGTGEIIAAATREHYSPVIAKNAIEILASIR